MVLLLSSWSSPAAEAVEVNTGNVRRPREAPPNSFNASRLEMVPLAKPLAKLPEELLSGRANKSWSAGRSALPAVTGPAFPDEPPDDKDHLGEGNPEVDDLPSPLSTPHKLLMGIVPGVCAFYDPPFCGAYGGWLTLL